MREEIDLINKSAMSDDQKASARFRLGTEGLGGATVSPWLGDDSPLVDFDKQLEDMQESAKVQTGQIADSFATMSDRILGSLQSLANGIRGGGFFDILTGLAGVFTQLGSAGLFGKGIQSNINAPAFGGARAMGGPVSMGKQYLVGENGPEIFAPGRSGQIIPNHKMGGQVVVINNSTFADAYVDGKIISAAPAIAAAGSGMAQAQMANSARRRIR